MGIFAARTRYLESIAEESMNNNSTDHAPCSHDRTYTPIMDLSGEIGQQLQPPKQRESRRRSQIPSPIKARGASNPPPHIHARNSSLSVLKLRQNFQQPEQVVKTNRTISPTLVPVTKLKPKPLSSSSVNSYVPQTRLPAQRRVATTPTTSLTPISEMRHHLPKSTPKYLYGDGFTTPLDSRRTFTPPKTMSPSVSTTPTPTPKSGTRGRRSYTTSDTLKILESKDEGTPEDSFRARARRSLATLESIKALKAAKEDTPGNDTPKGSARSKNASPADALSGRGSLRFSSAPEIPSEKKEVSIWDSFLGNFHLTAFRISRRRDFWAPSPRPEPIKPPLYRSPERLVCSQVYPRHSRVLA